MEGRSCIICKDRGNKISHELELKQEEKGYNLVLKIDFKENVDDEDDPNY